MIYFIFAVFFIIFLAVSFWLFRFLLRATDIMKYMFYILLYIVGILICFQALEKVMESIFTVSLVEKNFMFLVYLLSTMIGFLGIAIVTIKKLKKK